MLHTRVIRTVGRRIARTVTRSTRRLDSIYSRVTQRKRVLVATWREGRNFGDDYLSMALTRYLAKRFPKHRIVPTNLHLDGCQAAKDDVLLVGGGGLWGPCGTGRLSERLYATWMEAEGPLIIGNIGIESFDRSSTGQLLLLARKAALFSVRDFESWSITKGLVGAETVCLGADNTYLAPLTLERDPVRGCVAVNLCGPEQENYQRPYSIESIVGAVDGLKKDGCELIAVVFSYDDKLSDYKYCRKIDSECSRRFSKTPMQRCEVFLGMHFHSVLLALQNAIPVIAINYSDKVRRVMREYQLEEFCLEPGDPDLGDKLRALMSRVTAPGISERILIGNQQALLRLRRFEEKLQLLLA